MYKVAIFSKFPIFLVEKVDLPFKQAPRKGLIAHFKFQEKELYVNKSQMKEN